MTKRRSLLAALPLSLLPFTGCLSAPTTGLQTPGGDSGGDGGLPDGNGSDSGSTRPEATGGPGVTLAGVDAQPDGPLSTDVEITRDTATADHPPGLRVTVTNTGTETVTVGEARAVLFQYQHSTEGALVLLPAEFDAPAEPDCWRLTDAIAVTREYRAETLAPSASMAAELSLYASVQSPDGTCLPVGEHRFERSYTVTSDGDSQQFSWGFTVLLE